MKKIKHLIIIILLIGFPSTALSEKHIICASLGNWAPLEFYDENSALTGYTVDFLRAAGRIAGFTIDFRDVPQADIVTKLEKGEYDAICSSMINRSLREQQLAFTTPYLLVSQTLVVGNERKIFIRDDWSGKRFGAHRDSYGIQAAREMDRGVPKEYSDIATAMEDVKINAIDGAICDDPVAYYFTRVKYQNGLKINGYLNRLPKKPLSVAVPTHNKELLELLNKGISAVRLRGIDEELQVKWFSK